MDHLLMVVLLLWSSGAQCETTYKADIVLLMDSSGSIHTSDFGVMKLFFQELVSAFDIGPDRVQIGLVQYSDLPETEWHLNTHQTKQSLLTAIDNLQHKGGSTKTGMALEYILHNNFKPNVGMRADSKKIVVLITDGESIDNILLPSQNLKDIGIEVYAIGVEDADEMQLRSIASDPDETHVYNVMDFPFLWDIVNHLTINLRNSTNGLGAQCETTDKADIVILMDGSSSISSIDFLDMKILFQRIVRAFIIGPDRVQIGLVQYSELPKTEWHLNTHQTKQSLLTAIDNLQQKGGSTKTGMALEYILHNNFKPNVGMHEDSKKIVVLITDGESIDNILLPSQNLKDIGIEVYAIGVKDANEEQLRSIASDPDEIHMYNVMDVQDIVDNFTINLCNSAKGLEPVRLVDGASRCSGTLEVKRGEWRPVYGSHWTLKTAAVVCRELDCGSAVLIGMRNESLHKFAWEISSSCIQSGSALRECVSSGSSSSIMEITCSDSVRLVNGTSLCSGRLEVKSHQSNQWWSSVCEADFDRRDAEVVCRELGCGAPSVLQGGLYEEVEAPMWIKEFQCEGNESSLLDCRSSGSPRKTCSPGKAVRLTCSEPDDFRLVGGASHCSGTVELKQGDWSPVYGSYWTLKSAALVCRKLDCGSAASIGVREDSSKKYAWRISSDCVRFGSALRECATLSWSFSILELTCSDPAGFIIRLIVVLLTLLLFVISIYFTCKATRGQKPGPQENIELDYYNLCVCKAEGGSAEEEGARAAE